MTRLWIDDIRRPPSKHWNVVKSYDEFVTYINLSGVPDIISFDHDLGEGKTGMDCAKYLIKKELAIKDFRVHSMNPIGRENILGLLRNWKKFMEEKNEK